MGWDNPPVPWREFERRLSWGKGADQEPPAGRAPGRGGSGGEREAGQQEAGQRVVPVTRLPVGQASPAWAELHCHSSYSFLDGASSPADLVREAAVRGLSALAITDHDGMYGVPQFAQAAARLRMAASGSARSLALSSAWTWHASPRSRAAAPGLPGSARRPVCKPRGCKPPVSPTRRPAPAACWPVTPRGTGRLCRVISTAQLAGGEKGRAVYDEAALADGARRALGDPHRLPQGRGPRRPRQRAARRPRPRELAGLIGVFGRDNVKVELTRR